MSVLKAPVIRLLITIVTHYSGAAIRGAGYYGQGSGPVISYFGCRGTERSIFECQRYFTSSVSCSHTNDVGLDCERK